MILVESVTKNFGNVSVINDVTLELPAGESIVIVGPSGSGKTTLLRLIAGLEIPSSGEISIGGKLASMPGWAMEPNRRGIGFVFQSPALWPHMTIEQNILFGLDGMSKPEKRKRIDYLLERTGLKGLGCRYPDQISRGEARRVSIVRTLAPRPKRVIMDEALTNIDPEMKERVFGLIQDCITETGASLIFVTHDREEASRISGQKMNLVGGKLESYE